MTQRFVLAIAATLMTACSCRPTIVTLPAPIAAPTQAVAAPPAAAMPVQRGPLLRRARQLARQRNFASALAQMELLLQSMPRAPRLICEAGYIAHRAGDHQKALRYTRAAMALFGSRPDAELIEPAAMCLFNQGLAAEALGDASAAAESFRQSLALRPNARVQANLEALPNTARAEADDRAPARPTNAAGVELRWTAGHLEVDTASEEKLAEVIQVLFAGHNEFTGETERANVLVVASLLHTGPDVAAFLVDDGGVPLSNSSLVLAQYGEHSTKLVSFFIGDATTTDNGCDESCSFANEELLWEPSPGAGFTHCSVSVACRSSIMDEFRWPDHDDVACYRNWSGFATLSQFEIVCDRELNCLRIPRSLTVSESEHSSITCEDHPEFVPPPNTPMPQHSRPTEYELDLTFAADDQGIEIRRVSGAPPATIELGLQSWPNVRQMSAQFR